MGTQLPRTGGAGCRTRTHIAAPSLHPAPVAQSAERTCPSDTVPGLSKLPHAVAKEVLDEEL
jgi:hypothetical protein